MAPNDGDRRPDDNGPASSGSPAPAGSASSAAGGPAWRVPSPGDLAGTTASAVPGPTAAPAPAPGSIGAVAPRATSPAVASALEELAAMPGRPLSEHPDAFGRVHAGLQQALSDIDSA